MQIWLEGHQKSDCKWGRGSQINCEYSHLRRGARLEGERVETVSREHRDVVFKEWQWPIVSMLLIDRIGRGWEVIPRSSSMGVTGDAIKKGCDGVRRVSMWLEFFGGEWGMVGWDGVCTTQDTCCNVQNDLGWKLCGVGEAFIALSPLAGSLSPVWVDSSLRAQTPGHWDPWQANLRVLASASAPLV
jgi:hypothetical protein